MYPATSELLLTVECPRLKIKLTLSKQTLEDHIKPLHPINESHLPLIENIIKCCDASQSIIWYKEKEPSRMCIVRQVLDFMPFNRFVLIAIKKFSNGHTGCIASIYPVDQLPGKGYKLL